MFIFAVARLLVAGKKPKRTIHLTFMPDEETGGVHGMGHFIKSDDFKQLNVGCAFDEGALSPRCCH